MISPSKSTPKAHFGFNSQTFNRPYGIQPMFATERDSAGNNIEMSISETDKPSPFDQLYKYYKEDGLVETVDAEGNEVILNINDIPDSLRLKIIDAEDKA